MSDFHTSMATTIDMMKEVLRQPEEIQALFERQEKSAGPFSQNR
ncbi:hypothetical protein ACT7C5_10635 [Bacillus pacificus]